MTPWSAHPSAARRAARAAAACVLAVSLAAIAPTGEAHAAGPGDGPTGSSARTDPSLVRRVLPKRCGQTADEGRPCADLAESVDRWFDQVDGGGLGGGGSGSVALLVATQALVNTTTQGQDLSVSIGGTGPVLSWHVGAGVLHVYDRGAIGFSLSGVGGIRVARYSPWSVVLGVQFLNLTDFYDDEPEHPEQHILGELGVSFDAPLSQHLMMRFGLSATLGARRRTIASFEGAREVFDDQTEFSGGGALRIALWIR